MGAVGVTLGGGGVTLHADLSGLAADDHTQYYNQARGDARYALLSHTHAASDIISGTIDAARLPAFSGDISTSAGSTVSTLATVNSNVGSFALATITANAKGLITAASAAATTGSGSVVLASSPAIVTPTIASFVNAGHSHQNAAGGGSLDAAAIGSGVLANARVNWAAPSAIGSTTPASAVFTTISVPGAGANSERFGLNATTTPNGTAVGNGATTSHVTGSGTAIGRNASAAGFRAVAIGASASAANEDSFAMGANAVASADSAIAIGANLTAGHTASIAMGEGAATTKANQLRLHGISTVSFATASPAVEATDSGTNSTLNVLGLSHNSSGVVAAGFGVGLPFLLESSTTESQNAALIEALWNSPTHASYIADLVFSAYNAGTKREAIRVRGNTGAQIGLFGAAPVSQSTGWAVTNPVTRKTFDTTTVTLPQLAEAVGTIINYLISLGPLAA
jgi:hypothetical protein